MGTHINREDITALFARRADLWARQDADALAADYAETATVDSPMQGRIEGRARIHDVYVSWFKSFPDLVYTSKALVIDGNLVAQFFNIRGTQSAPFGGVPATGRRFEINGAMLFTIGPDGLFTHVQRVYDVTGMLVQLGVLKGKPVET
jgi:steroid delta-isomerase-like uncharacterized protein